MTTEKVSLDLSELQKIEVLGLPFGYKSTKNEEGTTNIVLLPFPNEVDGFNSGLKKFSSETLMLLRSKHYFGINIRSQMLDVLYDTFIEKYELKEKSPNDYLTLQAIYSEMIIKLGTIVEDFAGICYACKEYQVNGSDIAQVFLAYSDPTSFYKSIISKTGKRKIKQIFGLPQSKGDLNKIFRDLTEIETELLMKAIESSVNLIQQEFCNVSKTIIRKTKDNVTYYDMYNKLKHGFSPIYPFVIPYPLTAVASSNDFKIEELITEHLFENITIMHDKLPGQRTTEEQKRYKDEKLATPAFAAEYINLDTAKNIKEQVVRITSIYQYLINKYLLISKGDTTLHLFLSKDLVGHEENKKIKLIISDKSRYKI
ncbi:hypothetical protein QUH71_26415 (plasmid) [Priestia aryabhattai]|uniref:hypothetical protein n=1 Tax=Priestia aryabhattai TaxID=412384 RepID=UPI0025A4BEFA|nr:hypothetical protein [Priestia aryabhattai]WJN47503.1 hypothetical protein QUH71_26415 [Priestia aryabhattai]